jgi:hypothetical protein
LPLQRLDECKQCSAELHACKLCEWYSTSVAKHCRETIAEEVKDKERANFCDYFKPRPNAYSSTNQTAAQKAQSELAALFGGGSSSGDAQTPEERARAELEAMFKKK